MLNGFCLILPFFLQKSTTSPNKSRKKILQIVPNVHIKTDFLMDLVFLGCLLIASVLHFFRNQRKIVLLFDTYWGQFCHSTGDQGCRQQ
jgi:hypothetical protein